MKITGDSCHFSPYLLPFSLVIKSIASIHNVRDLFMTNLFEFEYIYTLNLRHLFMDRASMMDASNHPSADVTLYLSHMSQHVSDL
jgi:hypothetical protein